MRKRLGGAPQALPGFERFIYERLIPVTFDDNYRLAYNLVFGKQSEKVYEGVKAFIAEYLRKVVKEKLIPALPTGVLSDIVSRAKEGEELLKRFRSA